MASGTIKGTFTNLSASHLYPEIRWRSTKNDKNNNSSVTAELWFVRVNTAYISNNAYFLPRITINGDAAYPPNGTYAPFDVRKGTRKVWQRTVTVAHNADGAKSITIAAGGITGLSNLGNVSVSGTAKLDQIPRASSIGTISGNQIGSAITIPISRASGSFTHDVSLKLGNKTVSATGVGTSAKLTPNLADFCGQLPNSTSGSATITVITKSGSTTIGTKTKNHTIYVPSSVVSSITSFKTDETVSAVYNLGLGANVFVQNKSIIGMTAAAKGVHGSTIRDYTFSFNGASQGGTVGRQFAVGNASGTKEVKVVVTDSRGRKSESKHNVNILPYSAPKISKFNVYRVDGTTTVKADVSYTITNIASKGGTWYIDKLVGSTWSMTNSGTTTSTYTATVTLAGTYDGAKSHSFRTNLHDAFGLGATANGTVGTDKVALDLYKDVGIGVGKTYERGALDVGGRSYLNGVVSVKSDTNFTGDNWLMSFERRSTVNRLALATISPDEEHLRLHFYDKNGTWLKNHSFNMNGDVVFGKDVSVQGKVMENYVRVVDSWGNTNGMTQRFSNGVQICWKVRATIGSAPSTKQGGVYRTQSAIWTFPSKFVDIPAVSVYVDTDLGYTWAGLGDKASSTIYASVAVFCGSKQTVVPKVSMMAIGRWK